MTIVSVPDQRWRAHIDRRTSEMGEPVYRITDYQRALDSVIEFIDANAGRVIASARSDNLVGRFIDPHHVLSVASEDDGTMRVTVLQVRLHNPQPR